ncbi:MAG: reverse gyrase [Acidilobaceae archaeon]
MAELRAVFKGLCPNCGGEIDSERLARGLPCENCLASSDASTDREAVVEKLATTGRLAGYLWVHESDKAYREFSDYARRKLGLELWSAQKSWARRLLGGESFAIVAPTGVGKTTLLQLYSCYRVERDGWRVLYLAPTENLVRQVYERLSRLTDRAVAYYSSMSKRAREEALARIASGDFGVLVATPAFLRKRFGELSALAPFDLAVVDDVDSLLRDSGNVERLLELLGVPREAVETAGRLVRAKRRLLTALRSGRETRELEVEVLELESSLRRALSSARVGQLVVASATGRPRGIKHLVVREVLGFEAGGSSDYLRNVEDTVVVSGDIVGSVARVVEALGGGCIVFVSQALGREYVGLIAEELKKRGFRAEKALAGSWRSIIKLEKGEVDVLVTIASRYGVAVRGLDAPRRVRYTVFARAPARRVEAAKALLSPSRLLRLLIHIAESGDEEALGLARELREVLDKVDDPSLVQLALKKASSGSGVLAALAERFERALSKALSWLSSATARSRVVRVGSTVYSLEDGAVYAYVPDALTYIQASGRASRMLGGRMTFGLSIVVEPEEELVRALEAKASWVARIDFKPLDSIDLSEAARRIEESRSAESSASEAEVRVDSVLLVVESPTKAKTIAWFWGKPARRRLGDVVAYETAAFDPETGRVYLLTVVATRGHIFDLVESDGDPASVYGVRLSGDRVSPVYSTIKRCRECGASFVESQACPRCGSRSVRDSMSVVEALRRLSIYSDYVVVATDPDREGEKIAWDVALAVAPYNGRVYRARFYEVTRSAVLEALRSLSSVDEKLVYSQIARRVVDRWLGFHLSLYLKTEYAKSWLGAGRVQTPVLGWVIARYSEWKKTRGYRVCFELGEGSRVCVYTPTRSSAEELASSKSLEVVEASRERATLAPPPPYTTDSLLADASRVLKLSAEQAMRIAQDLFEAGLITYHRTDSTRVSSNGMAVAREYLARRGLGDLYKPRAWSSEGAHEAIRPTRPLDADELEKAILDGSLRVSIKLTWAHRALYDMIFRRFIASQMAEAEVTKARVVLRAAGSACVVEGIASVEKEGFLKMLEARVEKWLSRVEPGSVVEAVSARVYRGSLVSLLTSGDVVKMMREKGIGRPSTYHKAIEANKRHGYLVETRRARVLVPTRLGVEVYSRVAEVFPEAASEDYTRTLEEQLDLVERGELSPVELLENTLRSLLSLPLSVTSVSAIVAKTSS